MQNKDCAFSCKMFPVLVVSVLLMLLVVVPTKLSKEVKISFNLNKGAFLSGEFGVLAAVAENDRPIIGILTVPKREQNGTMMLTYISASYVKFVEMAGARAVPLHFDASDEELGDLHGQLNGVLIPGGAVGFKKTAKPMGQKLRAAGQLLLDLSMKANANDQVFPVHAKCLGFELLMDLVAKSDSVLCHRCFKAKGLPLPLNFTAAAKTSRLFSTMEPALFEALSKENLTENSHTGGVTPQTVEENELLNAFYTVTSINDDPAGVTFVSTAEAKQYPFVLTQWHPEKNAFEWRGVGEMGENAIPHSVHAIKLTQHVANVFVDNARLNSRHFASKAAEDAALIYNYAPKPSEYFQQIYEWERKLLQ